MPIPEFTQKTLERFWAKADKSGDCWVWAGTRSHGFPVLCMSDRRQLTAQRVSWELTYGQIPPGTLVRRKCNNPDCVRPEHLYLQSRADRARENAAIRTDYAPEVRFWPKVDKSGDCWKWTGLMFRCGYGQIRKPKGIATTAHRFAWELIYGPIPEGMEVCHSCDVKYPPGDISYRRCVNPDHLFLGSHQYNMTDMSQKGRAARGGYSLPGERNPKAKLTESNVLEIRRRFSPNERGAAIRLAEEFGVTTTNVRDIVKGKTWAFLPIGVRSGD